MEVVEEYALGKSFSNPYRNVFAANKNNVYIIKIGENEGRRFLEVIDMEENIIDTVDVNYRDLKDKSLQFAITSGNYLVYYCHGSIVRCYNLNDRTRLENDIITTKVFHQDGMLYCIDTRNDITRWDLDNDTKTVISYLPLVRGDEFELTVHEDNKLSILSIYDKKVVIWEGIPGGKRWDHRSVKIPERFLPNRNNIGSRTYLLGEDEIITSNGLDRKIIILKKEDGKDREYNVEREINICEMISGISPTQISILYVDRNLFEFTIWAKCYYYSTHSHRIVKLVEKFGKSGKNARNVPK